MQITGEIFRDVDQIGTTTSAFMCRLVHFVANAIFVGLKWLRRRANGNNPLC